MLRRNRSPPIVPTHACRTPRLLQRIWTFPGARCRRGFCTTSKISGFFLRSWGERKAWITTAIVVGGTAGVVKGDPPLERRARQTAIFSEYNKALQSAIRGRLLSAV